MPPETTYVIYEDVTEKKRIEAQLQEAQKMGADGVVNVRFTTSSTMAGAAELLAYGTAVKLRKL